jgi:ribose-phosphate pyrophosphokinase
MERPDTKLSTLLFFSGALKEAGARSVGAVIPYLPYMRQDRSFRKGEAVTSRIFAKFVSEHLDWLVTVDPHLHRYRSLSEIYSIPTRVVSASSSIAGWIRKNVRKPVLIGPDKESGQWISKIAKEAGTPFTILRKKRKGDRKVSISDSGLQSWKGYTPVLVDDIISSGATMVETLRHLKKKGLEGAVCIGVHALFGDRVKKEILAAGARRIVTCNTVVHPTNAIDLSEILAEAVRKIAGKTRS